MKEKILNDVDNIVPKYTHNQEFHLLSQFGLLKIRLLLRRDKKQNIVYYICLWSNRQLHLLAKWNLTPPIMFYMIKV